MWATRDEKENFSQRHDAELIKEQKRKEVEEEIRLQVDELMRAELKNLKAVSILTQILNNYGEPCHILHVPS